MPPVLLSPCDHAPGAGLYPCPVFRTRERGGAGNLAMVLHLPITGAVTAWIERGVALSIEKQVRGKSVVGAILLLCSPTDLGS